MVYLINEMILVLLATAIISTLLGMFLCKSNERAITAEKKRTQVELIQAQKQRDEWEVRANHWQAKLEESNDNLAQQTYEISSLSTQLEVAAKEREGLLMELKKNDICKARLASVAEQLECSQAQLQAALKKFELSQAHVKKLTTSNGTLEEKLKQLNDFKRYCHTLRASNESLKVIETEYYQLKEGFAELNQEHQKLIRMNTKLQENQKLLAQFQKMQEENKAYHALREQAAELLEERDQLYAENQQLQHELTSLGAAHDEQGAILHKLMSQRDDFLSRLHAVSSVVGAMSIGGGGGEAQQE